MVNADEDAFCRKILESLIAKTYKTSEYDVQDRFDGKKKRTIYKLPYYPDRIVHHALLQVIEPILTNCLIRDTFQSIKGRGTSDAAKRVKLLLRSDTFPKFALKVDIEKYYPSVNNEILKQKIRRKIKCKDTLWLIEEIIDSQKGLPIGNFTSQIFGNFYLNDFDWFVKQQLKPIGYFRYCDDILILASSKSELLQVKNTVQQELQKLDLKIKDKFFIYNVQKHGVDFVGYRFKPSSTRIRKSISEGLKFRCKLLHKTKNNSKESLSSLMAYKGWVRTCNAKRLWRKNTIKLRGLFPKQLRGKL